jgi:DNA-binding ferritin-like protein
MEQPASIFRRTIPRPSGGLTQSSDSNPIIKLVFELLNGVTKVHINHLRVNGPGAYAAHTAMGGFYDSVGDLADSIAEQYQGATEKIITYPTSVELPTMSTAEDCLSYMGTLYNMVNDAQDYCSYSEINNTLDEVKSLINSTKYKLLFLK